MKSIVIVTKAGYIGHYRDLVDDGKTEEEVTSEIANLFQSSKINILTTSESIIVVRPSEIALIEVNDLNKEIKSISSEEIKEDDSFEEILTDIQEEKENGK
jgi:hypothetical protein